MNNAELIRPFVLLGEERKGIIMDLVSIVIPIYNGEKYVDLCISQLLRQTYQNIEILCIPNNCSDRSVELCSKWAQKDGRVKVFVNAEKGTSLARKRGIMEAQGKYIVFTDCDDEYATNDAIEKMVAAIKEDNVQICQFEYIVQYPVKFLRRRMGVVRENRIYQRNEMLAGPFLGAVQGRGGNFNVSTCCKIYDSSVLKEAAANMTGAYTCGDDMQQNLYAFASELTQAVSGRKEAYYVYKVGRGITANPNVILMLLRDYQAVKMEIYEVARKLDVGEAFFTHLWSESLYCFKLGITDAINRGLDRAEVLKLIEEIDQYTYIQTAKDYFRRLIEKGWLDQGNGKTYLLQFENEQNSDNIRFMCSDYSSEDYYSWCFANRPKPSLLSKIKKLIRKLV